jgi:hypothetical protein
VTVYTNKNSCCFSINIIQVEIFSQCKIIVIYDTSVVTDHFYNPLIRQRLGEGITKRAIANELNVSKNALLVAKQIFVSVTRGIFVLCHHTIINLFVGKPELNGANLPNLDLNSCHFCPSFVYPSTVL